MNDGTPLNGTPAADPDLLYSAEEDALRDAVRSLLADRSGPATVLAGVESKAAYDTGLWRALATDIGAAGLLVPEKLGGAGASAREAAVVLEETGRCVAPVPYLTSAVIGVTTLLGCDLGQADVAAPLAALAGGNAVGVLAVPLPTAPYGPATPTVRAAADGALTGRVTSVADAAGAELLLVPAEGPNGPALYAVEAAADGVRTDPVTPLDLTRPLGHLTFDGAHGRLLATGDRARTAVAHALLTGAGLLASEQLGVAEWCLAETVRHTAERTQFGRPVGSFQALKHRMAALWLEVASARAAARNAADALATGSADAPVAVAVAQAYCAPVAVRAAQECIQLHGGIGMTWEHPAHLFLKRAKSDELALGSPGRHREALAGLVALDAPQCSTPHSSRRP
ncbi:Acyl-CoA dehydrogenase [Streptomyces sp. 2224.1]|uniref:acyl-CoA dehydrogenase family protein n=1 Tax=unclassified Streptomyces TaxID=2593676 RepID=UPI00088887E0|nr:MULTISPECIES: acyl-CoA dehydrogenase family protein [unclassified Streptomyces]PBC86352.1 alkylation response protein AidB-like acyl-CoA dehydrogenase [Streptomyces sp. 2321.6]SDQ87579.1 Acyl-CoA dehydrogenase [Streptomyces sp. KS_16]SED93652.1 Acyl-CoA dehydrogenase [Streptomyces sp. 2224.1]SED95763.1 Acyl-CoA dehydrogenase [Streptomyces sp. 2133.1]SNC73234.1 Acyl-CoA dehydrogenase [Streptomyces sp. 2114.4]